MRTRSVFELVCIGVVVSILVSPALGKPEASHKIMAPDPMGPQILSAGPGSDTTCVYFEDFQDGPSGWVAKTIQEIEDSVYWQQTTYDHGDGHGERGVMWCGGDDLLWIAEPGYANDWIQYLTKEFTLAADDSQVTYSIQYDTEPGWDFVYLDISTDGGANYTNLETWDGVSAGFESDTTKLTSYAGQTVTLRFRFESDGALSDEDGLSGFDSNGAVRLDSVQVTNHALDDFESDADGWTPFVPAGILHPYEYRLEQTPACVEWYPCDDYCWSWVAYDPVTLEFPHEEGELFNINIGIESPVIDIPPDASEYILQFDVYADLPLMNWVFYSWWVAAPPPEQGGNWQNVYSVYYGESGFAIKTTDVTSLITPGATQMKIRITGVDMNHEWGSGGGPHTAAPMFDNVAVYARNTNASDVPDTPTLCDGDADGDGVFDTDDLCPGEDASSFDSDGDGCVDDGAGGRHIEYWDRGVFPLTYYIHESGAPGISDGSDTVAITNAMQAWILPDLDASVTYGGYATDPDADAFDGVNLITFEDPDYAFGAGVIAVGLTTSFIERMWFANEWWRPGEVYDSDIIFNPAMGFKTTTDGPAEGTYIEAVATHELGHLFGLSHSPVRSSTMYFVLPSDTSAASLAPGDQMAMFKAYGTAAAMASASRLTGIVTDGYTSSPLPGAAVFVIDAAGGDTLGCEYTLPDGSYSFIGLPDGDYYVSVHPLDGSSAVGYIYPGYINALIESTAVTIFVAESWDSLESEYDDEADKDPIAVAAAGPDAVADIVTNIDDTSPEVTAVVPDSNATGVSIDTSVLIAFSEPINSATLQGNFNLTNTTTAEFVLGNATMLNDDSLLAFIPLSELSFDHTYELKLETGIEDLYGNSLADSFVIYFTMETEPPVSLASLSPNKGVIGMTISLNGKGFDPGPSNNTVSFNGTAAVISDASATQLVVTVPGGATSGPVTVYNQIQELLSNDLQFAILSTDEVPRGFESGICALSSTPYDLTVVSTGNYVFVATDAGAEVIDSDPASGSYMTATAIPISGGLSNLAAGPAGNRVYGVSNITDKFFRLSSTPGSMVLLSEKAIGAIPRGILIHPRGHRALIPTDEGEIQIWDIQESSPTFETQVGHLAPVDPNVRGELATYPAGDIMLAITGTGNMFVVNLDSIEVTDTVSVGVYPEDIAIDPLGNLAYACDEMGFVSVVSLTQYENLWSIRTGGTPDGIALTPAGSFAIVVNRELNLLSAIDLRETSPSYLSVVTTVDLPVNPTDIELSPDGDYAYTISEAEQTLVATALGIGPSLTTLSRTAGPVGTRLALGGSGFSADSSATVSFDGVISTTERLTDSSLTVVVPMGAASGEVSVITEVDGGTELESNAHFFEVLEPTQDDVLRLAGALPGIPSPPGSVRTVLGVSPAGDYVVLSDDSAVLHMLITDEASAEYLRFAGSLDLGSDAGDIVIAPDGNRTFVVLPDSGFVHVIGSGILRPDFLSLAGEVDFTGVVGSDISKGAISPDGSILLVSDSGTAQVHFVDIVEGSPTQYQIIATVDLASGPMNGQVQEMSFHPGGEWAYLPVRDSDPAVVLVLDTDPLSPTYQTVVNTMPLPGRSLRRCLCRSPSRRMATAASCSPARWLPHPTAPW